MNAPLKVAVTGLNVSSQHLKTWKAAPETDVVLVHDIDAKRAESVAREYSIPKWTTEFQEVLDSGADILDVSTPNHCHAKQSIAAMRAGMNVLCQKPMATCVEECQQMIDVSRETGMKLAIFMYLLDSLAHWDFKRAVQQGCLGQIASIRIRQAHRAPYLGRTGVQGWRSDPKKIGGGSFLQLGIHDLNLMLWMTGLDVESVMAYSDNLYCKHSLNTEDLCHAVARLNNGALFSMESGYSGVGSSIEIYGTEGRILYTERLLRVQFCKDFKGDSFNYTVPDEILPHRPELTTIEFFEDQARIDIMNKLRFEGNQHRSFARSVLEGVPLIVPAEIGLRDMSIIKAIDTSSAEGQRIYLD